MCIQLLHRGRPHRLLPSCRCGCGFNDALTKRSFRSLGRGLATKGGFIGGYFSSMKCEDARKRYLGKLHETDKNEWEDNVDLWLTYVIIGMYLLVTPSPYS